MSSENLPVVRTAAHAMPIQSMADIEMVGQFMARSAMFGIKNEDQGKVVALTCHMEGMTPFQLVRKYHFIDGRLTMRSDAMLAEFRAVTGGFHEIIERTAEVASVKLIDANYDVEATFTLTWAECQHEPFVKTKTGALKTNWATPRARMQMLWARVVSDGIRAFAPEVVCGIYAPEEVQDFRDSGPVVDLTPHIVDETPATPIVEPPPQQDEKPETPPETKDAEPELPELKPGESHCKACGGKKVSSAGKKCHPCRGTGVKKAPKSKKKAPAESPQEAPEPENAPTDPSQDENGSQSAPDTAGEVDTKPLETGIPKEDVSPDDATVMPVGKFRGNPWSRFDLLQLDAIVTKNHPAITGAHVDAIKAEMKRKGGE